MVRVGVRRPGLLCLWLWGALLAGLGATAGRGSDPFLNHHATKHGPATTLASSAAWSSHRARPLSAPPAFPGDPNGPTQQRFPAGRPVASFSHRGSPSHPTRLHELVPDLTRWLADPLHRLGLPWLVGLPLLAVGWQWAGGPRPKPSSRPMSVALAAASGLPELEDLHRPGDVVNGYEVVRRVGSGFSSNTYEAQASTGERVALKVISLRKMGGWKALDLFEREVKVLKALQHPGVPAYLDSFDVSLEGDVLYYLVQRLATGQTLAQLVADGWRPTEAQVYDAGLQLLGILEYLGSVWPPVVHRDIKPENIVVDVSDAAALKVSLVDFGGVVDAAKVGGFQSTVVGTYGYMAPEQYRGQASPRSDIFGAGATLLFLLSGRAPAQFPQARMRLVFRDTVDLPGPLAAVLERMLEPVEEDRYASAAEALAALRAAQAGVLLPAQEPLSHPRPEGTAVALRRSGDRLEVSLPYGTVGGDVVGTAAFTVLWTSIVAIWTRSALLAGAPVLFLAFSLPFWFTAVSLVRQTVDLAQKGEPAPAATVDLTIGREAFTVAYRVGQEVARELRGRTQRLRGAEVVDRPLPDGTVGRAVLLEDGRTEYWLGEGLAEAELQWVAEEIRRFLDQTARY